MSLSLGSMRNIFRQPGSTCMVTGGDFLKSAISDLPPDDMALANYRQYSNAAYFLYQQLLLYAKYTYHNVKE